MTRNKKERSEKASKRVEKGKTVEKYILRSSEVVDEEEHTHTVYGIDVPTEHISIPDIFTDRATAVKFVNTCNELELSTIHIYDVIEDVLA